MKPYRIDRLATHDRSQFDCGNDPLNRYLRQQVGQDVRRRFATCYLLVDQSNEQLAGYYTLSASSVSLADLPGDQGKLPRYPTVPVARIGRLAIDKLFQGKGLGGVMLHDAVRRASDSELGVYAIAVDAKDAAAVEFYQHHGFIQLKSSPRVLFLPISEALKSL